MKLLLLAATVFFVLAAPSQARSPCNYSRGVKANARCEILRAATRYHQSQGLALHIAWRESRFDPHATNSSSGAAGLYQFMPRTWQYMSARAGFRGHSPYEAHAAAYTAMWALAHGYRSAWGL